MSAVKAIRLSKVAKELNVGTATIIEFLSEKGHDVPSNPNTKIEPAWYELLLEKFQPDMLVKQKKEQALKQAEKDRAELFGKETPSTPPAPKVEIRQKTEESNDEVLIKSNMVSPSPEPERVETPKKVEEKPEPVVEQKPEVAQPEEKKKEEAPVVEKQEVKPAEEEEKPSEDSSGLKVVGKIPLDDLEKKSKKKEPSKKEPKKKEEAPAEKKAEEPKPEKEKEAEKPEVVKEAPVEAKQETPAEASSKPNESTEASTTAEPEAKDHSWKDKREELKGLTVLGKIDIKPFEPKKKKSEEGEDGDGKKKRKRKRITSNRAVSSTDNKEKLQKISRESQDKSRSDGNRGPGPRGGSNDNQRKRRRSVEKAPVDDKAIQNQIKETLNRLTNKDAKGAKTKLRKKKKQIQRQKAEEQMLEEEFSARVLEVTEFITASELGNLMGVSVTEVITACMSLGMMVSINQRIDAETISLVADEFGFDVTFKEVEMDEPSLEEEDNEDRMEARPPIVTIMGHVDHGKTSLLDYIRNSNVIGGEAGGITQHIGAYEVEVGDGKKITFLDTPGHEAFTAMRARGAKVTDIVIIVVAADDKVMPQTKEAISHAQAAGVPMVFAINKIDREVANPELIKQQLADENILVEDWGGKFQCQEISAKKGINIDELLEKVLFEAELLELKADPGKRAVGTVIEASLDKGRGIVSTVLVQAGTMRIGDNILAGAHFGKVKAMTNERGKRLKTAGPSTAVQILGFDGAPTAGDKLYVTKSESDAKSIASDRSHLIREQGIRATKHITLDEIGRRIAVGNFKELNVIVKGDVDGSVEALSDSLLKLTTEEIQVNVIHKGVGQISESDVLLATASDAIIIGFQVRPSVNARNIAEKESIDIRLYSIIYDAIDEIKLAMEGMLEPKTEEKIVANIEIRETFKITRVGTIAGCYVTSGKVNRNHKVRVIRDGIVRYDGELASLKRFKDDVKEVAAGYECGLQVEKYNDIAVGDIIEAYELVEVKRKL